MSPTISPDQALGFSLCLIHAAFNWRCDEVIDLATSNLSR